MKKKIMIVFSSLSILLVFALVLMLVNLILPKDFSGYYKDIDMAREELPGIYDNGVFVCTQKRDNEYTDFIIGKDVCIVRIKQKDTILGSKYRIALKDRVFDFYKILEKSIEAYNERNEIYFISIGWLDGLPQKPDENMLWAVLPAEYMLADLGDNVSTYKFIYEGEEYVLYIKVENIE